MRSAIVGYRQDEAGDWIAELACGHRQHVRHRPPWQLRPWVVEAEGRQARLGTSLDCPLCDTEVEAHSAPEPGGEAACLAHLVCPGCGVVIGSGPHRDGCVFEHHG